MPKEVKHWSYSSLSLFEECPQRWYYSKVARLPDPPSRHLIRGNEVHDQMEAYLSGRVDKPRIDVDFEKPIRELLDEIEGYEEFVTEEMWHFDREWSWIGTGFSYESWLLVKMDFVSLDRRHIVDWKTGQIYEDKHLQQARLYALAAASRTFETEWRVDMVYLDKGHVWTIEVDASDLAGGQDRWGTRAEKIFEAQAQKKYEKKPGAACKYRPWKASKGGPCSEG